MSSNLHPMLNVAIKAARAAGAIINRAALDVESVRISQKQINDFVTEVDHASEKASSKPCSPPTPATASWPKNRAASMAPRIPIRLDHRPAGRHHQLHPRLSRLLRQHCAGRAGKVEQAVIYDPTRNDLFTATKGRGAYLNERRIRVSKRTQLKDCLISTGFPFRKGDNFKSYLKMMGDVMQRTAGLRRPGAAALDLAYVAAGFTDGFFETGLSIWDVAAGSLLVTEAGGLVGNFTGEADFLEQRECLAGNPRVYGQLVPPGQVQQVRQCGRQGGCAPGPHPHDGPVPGLKADTRTRCCSTAWATSTSCSGRRRESRAPARHHADPARPVGRQPVVMAGVPFHSLENYLARLIKMGESVAIASRWATWPPAKGPVERKVVRVVTPGTLTDSELLSDKSRVHAAGRAPGPAQRAAGWPG
jgi:myo-inositol-1(or 4)-monophosphatase